MRRRRDLGVYPLAEGLALYHAGSGRLHILNATGALLWQGLRRGDSYARATAGLARRFGVPAAAVRRDAADLYRRLKVEDLLGGRRASTAAVPAPARRTPAVRAVRAPESARRFRIAGRGFEVAMPPAQWRAARPVLEHLAAAGAARSEARFAVSTAAGRVVLARNGAELAQVRTAAGLQHALIRALVEFVFESPRFLTALHAGAVRYRGRCLVFPAAGGRGKTTLVAGLMRHGARVLADDLLALEAQRLRLVAVPLPLRFKQGSWALAESLFPGRLDPTVHVIGAKRVRLLPPERPAGREWQAAHRVDALVSPEFRPGAAPALQPCGAAEMLEILFGGQSLLLGRPAPRRVGAMVRWLATVPSYRLVYGSLDEALELLEPLAPA